MSARGASGLAAVVVTLGLVGAAPGNDPPSRTDVLEDFGAEVATPAFERFDAATATLTADVESACDARDVPTIAAAVATIDETRTEWLSTEAYWTGPAMESRSAAVIDWPVNVADIEALIDRSMAAEITAEIVGNNVGADTRGLSAMRYVLSGDDALERLDDDRWCDYLRSAAEVIADEAELIVSGWTESFDGGPSFGEVLADSTQTEEWLGMLVNDIINLVHRLAGSPDDRSDVAPVDPSVDRAAGLAGVAAVADALAPLLGDDLAGRLGGEIEGARSAYGDGDFDLGRERAAEVEATLATEVASRLGVTIGFSDADGDSSG